MTKTNNRRWNLGAVLSLATLLGLAGQPAHAVVAAQESIITSDFVDAASPPLGQGLPSFIFTFGSDFDMVGFDVTIDFDPTKLSFNAAASTLKVGAQEPIMFPVLLAMVKTASLVPGSDPAEFDFLYTPGPGDFGSAIGTGSFTMGGAYLSQSILVPQGSTFTMNSVFNMLQGFVPGATGSTPVRVSGEVYGEVGGELHSERFDVTATVTAVPEPETWLMLLGGLGLLASRVRRHKR